jgi:hypothetical protein
MPDTFEFPAPVLKQTDRDPAYHYIPVPPDIAETLIESGTRRVIARINEHEVRRSLFGHADGEYAIIVGLSILRDAGVQPGDVIILEMHTDPRPDHVDICEEFRAALEQDPEAMERFESFSTGKQRSLAYHVNSAKRSSTRVRRALDLTEKIRTRTLYGDRNGG